LSEVTKDVQRTRHSITDIEKSLNTLSEKQEFTSPNKTLKGSLPEGEKTAIIENRFSELQADEDGEVIFKGIETAKSMTSTCIQVIDESLKDHTTEKSNNTTKSADKIIKSPNSNADHVVHKTVSKKEKVYLIGDSISGQVNPATLGKRTNTFVKKLRAPKLEDLNSFSSQVKDAKMILIHTGTNNIRQKESTEDCVNILTRAVTSFREVAPECKVVVSKIVPIGDHDVDIDRSIFNANSERKLTEINKTEIGFIDHGNLAERGVPIKDYYRQDVIHLSGRGVEIFADNLEREIKRILKKDDMQDGARGFDDLQQNKTTRTKGYGQYNDRGWQPYKHNHM
ncbi:MAG: SGNH/GDSL hydrolase family protein, partial [Candidatus Thiodiazotropha endolucinida]|nr:SGNH/GDSL hydrolase family protein [Candidatus Thiodiazotropha taylori]MCW4342622.1 SGNH/GDSL hydrolase family protein [Candidatus Thiodiazotropha endolucinida]